VVVVCTPAEPAGLGTPSVSVAVSSPSTSVSFTAVIVSVRLVTPGANVSAPDVGVKSVPGVADTALELQGTVIVPALPPVRVTVIAAGPPSVTAISAAAN
jgi:hypothetical protein